MIGVRTVFMPLKSIPRATKSVAMSTCRSYHIHAGVFASEMISSKTL